MKKISIFISLFLVLSLLPAVGLLITGPSKPAANEVLSEAPSLLTKDGSFNMSVLDETEDYIGDHFAFRQELATAWAELNAGLLKTSVENQVILGSDGWLYFEETLDDYMGKGLSDEELRLIAERLAAMQAELEAKGICFIFTIAPNKSSLYPEHMPDSIPKSRETSNVERLVPYLEEAGVRYVDLFSAFEGEEEILYFATDSHWTSKGAALAADTLLTAEDIHSDYFEASFVTRQEHKGDLYEMLCPTGKRNERDMTCENEFHFSCLNEPKGGNAITIRTENGLANGRLYCWRDSSACIPISRKASALRLFRGRPVMT